MKRLELYGKKGSHLVEGAIVMPLALLAVFSVLYLLTSMYTQVAVRSQIHLALRAASGIHGNTVSEGKETEGGGGLYRDILQGDTIRRLAEEQAEKRLCPITGLGELPSVSGNYKALPLPQIRLAFEREYGGRWLLFRRITAVNEAFYYNLDEAQWIRNQDWMNELGKSSDGP